MKVSRNTLTKVTSLLFLLTIPALSFADTAAIELQQQLKTLRTMRANFTQVVSSKKRVIQRARGRMALKRPGKFRWDTRSPNSQLIVADGKNLWTFDRDLEQVSVKPLKKNMGNASLLFLTGNVTQLTKDYTVSKRGNTYQLKPLKQNTTFQSLSLIFKNKRLTGMRLIDNLDQITRLSFSKIRINTALPNALFTFRPPKGADVIGRAL